MAGITGLDREVIRPAILRTRAPAFELLTGGELALASLEILRLLDDRLTVQSLVVRLVERDVSALAIVGEVDTEAIEQADRSSLPLLVLNHCTDLHELERSVTTQIFELRAQLYQQGAEIYRQLVELSMAERGLTAIVQRLAEISGRTVALYPTDFGREILAHPDGTSSNCQGVEDLANIAAEVERRLIGRSLLGSNPPTIRLVLPANEALVAPVIVHETIAGYLTLLGPEHELDDLDRLALARGSAVCALEMAKQRAIVEAEERLRGDFFEDMLGGLLDDEALLHRARHLGYDLTLPYAALAIRSEGFEPANQSRGARAWAMDAQTGGQSGSGPLVPDQELMRFIGRYLKEQRSRAPVVARLWGVLVLCPMTPPQDLESVSQIARGVKDYLARTTRRLASVGVGRIHPGLAGLRVACQEAEQAVMIGRHLFGAGTITSFADLGVYRLLFALRDSQELLAFCSEALSSLLEYDNKNGVELVKTLEAFFACRSNLQATADALFLHRNSLSYRLRRIEEISGLDLDDVEDRLRFQLALKARRVLPS